MSKWSFPEDKNNLPVKVIPDPTPSIAAQQNSMLKPSTTQSVISSVALSSLPEGNVKGTDSPKAGLCIVPAGAPVLQLLKPETKIKKFEMEPNDTAVKSFGICLTEQGVPVAILRQSKRTKPDITAIADRKVPVAQSRFLFSNEAHHPKIREWVSHLTTVYAEHGATAENHSKFLSRAGYYYKSSTEAHSYLKIPYDVYRETVNYLIDPEHHHNPLDRFSESSNPAQHSRKRESSKEKEKPGTAKRAKVNGIAGATGSAEDGEAKDDDDYSSSEPDEDDNLTLAMQTANSNFSSFGGKFIVDTASKTREDTTAVYNTIPDFTFNTPAPTLTVNMPDMASVQVRKAVPSSGIMGFLKVDVDDRRFSKRSIADAWAIMRVVAQIKKMSTDDDRLMELAALIVEAETQN